jgi:hypothetical protein
MTKKQIKEIKNFLVYLHLSVASEKYELNVECLQYLLALEDKNPQFEDIQKENQKIFKWLDEENEK